MNKKRLILIDIELLLIPIAVLTWGNRDYCSLYIIGIQTPLLILLLRQINDVIFYSIKIRAEAEKERRSLFATIQPGKGSDSGQPVSEFYRPFVLPVYIKIIVSGWNAIHAGPGGFSDRTVLSAPV